jgi:hypothetical protein
MPRFKSVVTKDDLKKAIAKLPPGASDEELRFRAVTGEKKGEKTPCVGIFIGPQMLTAYEKEKGKFTSSHLFEGTVKRSTHDPEHRLVLIPTRGDPKALKEAAKGCFQDAKLNYKVVTHKPGEVEPQDVPDDDSTEQTEPEDVTNDQGQVPPEKSPLRRDPYAYNLANTFPPGLAEQIEKQTTRLVGGTGKEFTPVLTALKALEKGPTPGYLDDLEAAATAYLKHVDKDYSDKDKSDKINQVKIATAKKALADVAKLRKEPTEFKQRVGKLTPSLKQALALKNEQAKEISHQFFMAEQAATGNDYARAGLLLDTVEQLIAEALNPPSEEDVTKAGKEQYEKAREAVEGRIKALKTGGIPPEKTKQVEAIYDEAVKLGTDAKYDDALLLLDRAMEITKAIVGGMVWEKKVDVSKYRVPQGKIKSGSYGTTYLLEKTDEKVPGLVLKVGNNEQGNKSLEHEAEIYEKIGNHPNIARCLGMKDVGGQKGLLLEQISGGDMDSGIKKLRERLEKGEIKHEEFWGVMQFSLGRTLEALDHFATLGYTHLDIKSNNIMYDGETGEVKLIDMGEAAKEGEGAGGTPGFVAPEVILRRGTHKSDVFSVGGTTYEVGEGKVFDYNRQGGDTGINAMEFARNDERPLNPPRKGETEVSQQVDDKTGKRQREPARHKAETAYVEFVNWLMNPDPKQRPTAREALNHPFLKDRMLDDDKARELVKSLVK